MCGVKRVVHSSEAARHALGVFTMSADWSKPYLIEFKRYKPPRTCEQNALMHVLWRDVALHVGRGEDEIKEIFKHKWGPQKLVTAGNMEMYVPMSTTDYTHEECSNMIERIYQVGAEWGVEFTEAA